MKKNVLVKIGDKTEARNVEMTAEEIAELEKLQEEYIGAENEVEQLKAQVAMLTECLLEMSEAVYA